MGNYLLSKSNKIFVQYEKFDKISNNVKIVKEFEVLYEGIIDTNILINVEEKINHGDIIKLYLYVNNNWLYFDKNVYINCINKVSKNLYEDLIELYIDNVKEVIK